MLGNAYTRSSYSIRWRRIEHPHVWGLQARRVTSDIYGLPRLRTRAEPSGRHRHERRDHRPAAPGVPSVLVPVHDLRVAGVELPPGEKARRGDRAVRPRETAGRGRTRRRETAGGCSHLSSLLADVEAELERRDGRIVPTTFVGDLVSERLRELDTVAYVRFISVYEAFSDPEEFLCELDAVLEDEADADDANPADSDDADTDADADDPPDP